MMNRRNFNRSLLGLFGAAAVPGVSTKTLIDPYVNRFTVEKHKICSPECLEDMKNWGCFDDEVVGNIFEGFFAHRYSYSKELIND